MYILTSASGFKVSATVAELEARVVAVARLVRGVLYDGVDGRLLDYARRVPAGTAEFRLQTATGVSGGDGERQEDGGGAGTEHRRTDRDAGTTSHSCDG